MSVATTDPVSRGGVRERKRMATRVAIQRAVLTLSLERGFDGVTVEEISHEAGVSPRTFFNYFPTKEAAVLGDVPELPDEEAIARFVAAGPEQPVLDGIRDLLLSTADREANPDAVGIESLRRKLLREHPHLFTMRMVSMKQLEMDLFEIVERRLLHDDQGLSHDLEQLQSRARLVTFVAFAAIRHSWSCWAEAGGRGPLSDRLMDTFAEMHDLLGERP